MGKEIERKFLVNGDSYKTKATEKRHIRQAYLAASATEATVRVRVMDDRAFLTVKSPNRGAERGEWEYEIPVADAGQMAALAGGWAIDKTRWMVPEADGSALVWEVDEFHERHSGLVVAEIELPRADAPFHRPDWLGAEVTGQEQYYNSSLAQS